VLSVTTLNAATLTSDSQLQNNTLITDLQDFLWQHPDFMQLLECLGKDREVGGLVRDLKTTFEALAELYAQLNSSDPDVEALQHTQAKFRSAVRTFADNSMPPCAYRMKFYDHAWLDHVVSQTKELRELHMSLALLSSKFLEANNKCVKAVLRRLSGGGTRKANMSHLPLVQGFLKCGACSYVVRHTQLYPSFAALVEDEYE
jgi:hypothetical protein